LFFREDVAEGGPDIFFAGHVERSRLELITAALSAGLEVRLYGTGWERHAAIGEHALGEADIPTLRREAGTCCVALCVVRHDNRDGHSMRTFELAASGACMLVEDTMDHRQLFGPDGEQVDYFATTEEMLARARALLQDPELRQSRRNAVHAFVVDGNNTYADRLVAMLGSVED
jgi:spore maturation protein CgeB